MPRKNNLKVKYPAIVLIGLCTTLLAFVTLAVPAFAGYSIRSKSFEAGGLSSGGKFKIKAILAQPNIGTSAGGSYTLVGGFWPSEPLCTVEFHHFVRFAEHWLEPDCNALNGWCGGADLDQLGDVDGVDLRLFVNEWLYYCPYDWPLK